jgi:hypothetical protein
LVEKPVHDVIYLTVPKTEIRMLNSIIREKIYSAQQSEAGIWLSVCG